MMNFDYFCIGFHTTGAFWQKVKTRNNINAKRIHEL